MGVMEGESLVVSDTRDRRSLGVPGQQGTLWCAPVPERYRVIDSYVRPTVMGRLNGVAQG